MKTPWESENCRSALGQAPVPASPLTSNTRTLNRFYDQLDKSYSEVPRELRYFVDTLYNVFARTRGYKTCCSGNDKLYDVLRRLPANEQIEFLTQLKHHPLLAEASPPGDEAPFTSFAPHYLPENQRLVLNKILSEFDLPNYLAIFTKDSPLVAADLLGTLHFSFESGATTTYFRVYFTSESHYRFVTTDPQGKVETAMEEGNWSVQNGVVYLQGKYQVELHMEDATDLLLRRGYFQLMRIQPGHAIGFIHFYLDPAKGPS